MDFDILNQAVEYVESRGRDNAISPKGALGAMQTMPNTLRDPGFGVRPAADRSPAEMRRVGQDYLKAMVNRYGDLPTSLAAYNWGPGNADKWKASGGDMTKLPAETRSYIEQVKARLGEGSGYAAPRPRQVDNQLGLPPTPSAVEAGIQASLFRPSDAGRVQRSLEADAAAQRLAAEAAPTAFERFGAAVAGNTDNRLVRGVVDRLFGEEFEPAPGYRPDLKALPPEADSDLITDYGTATSPQAAAKVLSRWQDEQERTRTVMAGGFWSGMGLSLLAEGTSVSSWVAPFAATRALAAAGKGSIVAAEAGQTGRAISASVTENVLSGTAVEAVAQGLEGRFRPQDLAISLTVDSLLGAGVGAMTVRQASLARAERYASQAVEEAVAKETRLAAQAEAKLGPTASPEAIRAEMDSLRIAEVREATTPPLAQRRVLDVEDTAISASDNGWGSTGGGGEIATPKPNAKQMFEAAVPDSLLRESNAKVVVANEANLSPAMRDVAQAVKDMAHLLPSEVRVALGTLENSGTMQGAVASQMGKARIAIKDTGASERMVETAMHEVTHAITDFYLPNATPAMRQALLSDFAKFVQAADAGSVEATMMRWADMRRSGKFKGDVVDPSNKYEKDFGEWLAEQGVRYFREDAAGANKTGFSKSIVDKMTEWVAKVWSWFTGAKERGHLPPTQSFVDFMTAVANKEIDSAVLPERTTKYSQPAGPASVANEIMTDPDAIRFGLNIAPVDTAAARAQAQAMLALHKKAEEWAKANPMDAKWQANVKNLADNNVFNVASTGLLMLKSPSPLVRMIASELLEDASGVQAKRGATAAIAKHNIERRMMANTINDVEQAYKFYKAGKGTAFAGFKDDMVGGKVRAEFDRAIASEIEARRAGGTSTQDKNVLAAADSIEAAYQRVANEQRRVKTLGSEGLPKTSRGYMPHRMSAGAVINLSNAKTQVLHSALVDQFITIEGWDAAFSDKLASNYIKRVRDRAAGDYGSSIGGGNTSTASLVEEALRGMDLPSDVVANHMEKFNKGAANFTKGRIELDLNKVYDTPDGEFKLLDIFETNQIELLRSQVGRASGEVALTQFGVRGKPGLKLLRDAMQYGADGQRAGNQEKEAFDQIAAEFLNEPFGNAGGKWMDRAMQANTLVRLGGVVFNQFAESINGIVHVGAMRTMASLAGMKRLNQEIRDLAAGKAVDNPFLSSIEHAGGAEFGTDAYKIVMPFDSPNHAYPTYGQDTLTLTDRLLRGGGHAQAVLSGWRMIHSAQQRGMAEQIVHKMARYIREGGEDKALDGMGIDAGLRAALKADLPNIATFDAAGRLTRFDVTKVSDPDVRERVIQAVWRGTSQIIQGTYIGERGKWAHDGWLKLMTQFRTFSITSMEKQWGRQRNSHGQFAAFGMLMGSMSLAVPVYMARVYANSAGREDRDAYIEERLQPQHLARATLNYVAMSGMAGDFLDLTTSLLPDSMGVAPTGGRSGVESAFIGNYVAPSLSLVDDIWKYAQSPDELDEAAKLLPGSRIPYLLPFVNALKD